MTPNQIRSILSVLTIGRSKGTVSINIEMESMRQPKTKYKTAVAITKTIGEGLELMTSLVKASEIPDNTINREKI